MAQGHSFDEYLETIYFLANPIGEYTPNAPGAPTLASRVAEMLGVSRASAGEMLKRLEADELIERIRTRLGDPERCPHGWPVEPDVELAENSELEPLSALPPGARATIVRLAEHDGDLLHWFYDEGLVPGTAIELRAAEPAAGQFRVRLDGADKAIGERAAAGLFVRPAA